MKEHEIFKTAYLKAADLGNATPTVTVERVESEDMDDGTKRVVYFKGKEKGLVLNKTNWNMLAEITGQDDDDNWVGHKVKLYVTKVDYQGKRVPAIRIDYPPKGNQPAPPPPPPVEEDDSDLVPF